MKIKTGGAVAALPPLNMINVKKGEEVRCLGAVSYKGVPHVLCICDRLEASLLVKPKRLTL